VHTYVDWLADGFERTWGVRPQVYVDLWASLNGRRYQPLIDATVDLASAPIRSGGNDWIVPLEVPLEDQLRSARTSETPSEE
jgi:hypothetical protein